MNRLARFKIDTWSRHSVLSPNGDNYKKLSKEDVSRAYTISRMHSRTVFDYVERFIIGRDDLYISCDFGGNKDHIFAIDENYCYKPVCKFAEWKKSPAVEDFEKKYKRQIAIEKLSRESALTLQDERFNDYHQVRITVMKGDTTYELPTHKAYYSIDQTAYYVDLENGKLVLKEIEYDQQLYWTNVQCFASYLNIPKERIYLIYNHEDYNDEHKRNWCNAYLDGECLSDDFDNVISPEELVDKLSDEIKANIAKQTMPLDKLLDFNDEEVEFYVDIKKK